jgi:2,5-diamino-6-(ribosylamino)-4(3H)-pyrimidinone 5'-phosphate reductase
MDGFTGGLGLYYGLAERFGAHAMLSGSNTILAAFADPPSGGEAVEVDLSSVEKSETQRQLLVVVDSRGRIHNWRFICQQPYWGDVVVLCSQATPAEYLVDLQHEGVDYILAGVTKIDLRTALLELNARYKVEVVRVDSGGMLNGALLRAGLVDEVSVLISPSLTGGVNANSIFQAPERLSPLGENHPPEVIPLRLVHLEHLDGDVVWLRYEVERQ